MAAVLCSIGLHAWLNRDNSVSFSANSLFVTSDKQRLAEFKTSTPYDLNWQQLLPDEDREQLTRYKAGQQQSLSEQVYQSLQAANDDKYQQALISVRVVERWLGKAVRLSGFVVPLAVNDDRTVSDFFLVPYFGACLHYPPPPPNQIVFVRLTHGMPLPELTQAVSVSGYLKQAMFEDPLGTSAYQLEALMITNYHQPIDDFREH